MLTSYVEPAAPPRDTMRGFLRDRYGPPAALELRELPRPLPADDELLVRVRATSVNPADWYGVTGRPYFARAVVGLRRPKSEKLGVDFAGTVEDVGKDVTLFSPGDSVYGGRDGAFAEYLCVREGRAVAPMPAGLTFEQAAAMPVAAITALQALRDHGRVERGQKVLVNGASGGVGTFAVQLAKAFGAEVTAVCSTRNVDLVRSLGAERVVDYTRDDFTRGDVRYDLVLDIAGTRSWSACKRVLSRNATLVIVGGPKTNRWLGPLGHTIAVRLSSLGSRRRVVFFIAKLNREDLLRLRDLVEAGSVTPVLDRQFELSELPAALDYLGQGHSRAKNVVSV